MAEDAGRRGAPLDDPKLAQFVEQTKQAKYDKLIVESRKAEQVQRNHTYWNTIRPRTPGREGNVTMDGKIQESLEALSGNLQTFQDCIGEGGNDAKMHALTKGLKTVLEMATSVAKTSNTQGLQAKVSAGTSGVDQSAAKWPGATEYGNLTWQWGDSMAGKYPKMWKDEQKSEAEQAVKEFQHMIEAAFTGGAGKHVKFVSKTTVNDGMEMAYRLRNLLGPGAEPVDVEMVHGLEKKAPWKQPHVSK